MDEIFLSKDSKNNTHLEIRPLGAELWLFKDSTYFTISNRNRYSKLLTIYFTIYEKYHPLFVFWDYFALQRRKRTSPTEGKFQYSPTM